MTKASLATKLHETMGYGKKEALDHVETLISLIKENLEQGEKIKIAGFGVFETRQKNARRGRNPQTGDAITLDARRVLTFKPSNILKDKLNIVAP